MSYPSLKCILTWFTIAVFVLACNSKSTPTTPKDTTASRTAPVATATTLTSSVPLTPQMTKDVKSLMVPIQTQISTLQLNKTADSAALVAKNKKDSLMWAAKLKSQTDTINYYKNVASGTQFQVVNGVLVIPSVDTLNSKIAQLQSQISLLKAVKTP